MANELSWGKSLDNLLADTGSASLLAKSFAYALLQAFLSAGWNVEGSSDASTAGMDGVNRFAGAFDAAKWTRASEGVAHSWVVVGAAGLGAHVCINFNGTNDGQGLLFFSAKTAFTGGSVTLRPTSVDEVASSSVAQQDGLNVPHRMNVVYSTRGDVVIFDVKQGVGREGWGLIVTNPKDLSDEPGAVDIFPTVLYQGAYSSGGFLTSQMASTNYWSGRTGGGISVVGKLHAPIPSNSGGQSALNNVPAAGGQFRHKYPAAPLDLWISDNAAGGVGDYKGRIMDVVYGMASIGSGQPDNPAAPTRIKVGDLWLPLDTAPTF